MWSQMRTEWLIEVCLILIAHPNIARSTSVSAVGCLEMLRLTGLLKLHHLSYAIFYSHANFYWVDAPSFKWAVITIFTDAARLDDREQLGYSVKPLWSKQALREGLKSIELAREEQLTPPYADIESGDPSVHAPCPTRRSLSQGTGMANTTPDSTVLRSTELLITCSQPGLLQKGFPRKMGTVRKRSVGPRFNAP